MIKFILAVILASFISTITDAQQAGRYFTGPRPYFNPLGRSGTNFVAPMGRSPIGAFGTNYSGSAGAEVTDTNVVLDFEGGINGSVVGTNLIHTFALGVTNLSSAGAFQIQSNGVTVTGAVTMVISTAQAARGTRSMRVNYGVRNVQILMPLKSSNIMMSYGFAVRLDAGWTGATFASYNHADLHSQDGIEYTVANLFDSPDFEYAVQTGSGLSAPPVTDLANNTWYWITVKWDGLNEFGILNLYVYSGSGVLGTLLGTTQIDFLGPKYPHAALFGRPDNHGADNIGAFVYLDDFVIKWDGTFPVLPP